MNRLFYGDNLEILRGHVADESVDLVYLDPPFNSNRSYNVIFSRHAGDAGDDAAQIGRMGQDIVGMEYIGLAAAVGELLR